MGLTTSADWLRIGTASSWNVSRSFPWQPSMSRHWHRRRRSSSTSCASPRLTTRTCSYGLNCASCDLSLCLSLPQMVQYRDLLLILLFLASTVPGLCHRPYRLRPRIRSPRMWGTEPVQPVPYSTNCTSATWGSTCCYCRQYRRKVDFAAIPPTETCINCYKTILPGSDKNGNDPLKPGLSANPNSDRLAGTAGTQVTTVPDYVLLQPFGPRECGHFGVNATARSTRWKGHVYQAKPMNMVWCIQCHRAPDRPHPPAGYR